MKPTTDDWGGTLVDDASKPQGPAQGNADDWGGIPAPAKADEIHQLISQHGFDPAQYAVATGDQETAFQARKAMRNRSIGEKAGAFGETLLQPETYGNALKGVAKFGMGLVATPLHTLAQGAATAGAPIAGAVGADNLQRTLENEQQTQGAEATLAAQKIEQGLRGIGRGTRNVAQDLTGTDQDEATQRQHFSDEIEAAKNAQQLAESRPLNTGAVGTIEKAVTGTPNLSDIYSPEALQAQGARPVSQLLTESMSAAADPTNLAIPLAAEIPGVKQLAGGIVQAGGKLLKVPDNLMGMIPKFRHTATPAGIYGAVTHPSAVLPAAGAFGLAKTLGWLGRAMDEQGAAMRTGIPSASDVAAQSAASTGTSALGANASRFIGNTSGNIVATALGFAPINYLMSGGDPSKFAESEVGAGVMGGIFGLAGDRQKLQDIAQYRLAKYGAQQFTDNPLWQNHQMTMAKFAPEDQQRINVLRGVLNGGTGTDVLVLDGPSFAQKVGQIGGDARGQFAQDQNTIYLNVDAIGKTPTEKAAGAINTAGHETGHAVVDFLRNAGREADAEGLFSSIARAMTPEQMQALTNDYHGKLLASTDTTGKTPEEIEAIKQRIAADNPLEKIAEENLAEITRKILNGRPIASFALPLPLKERIMDAAQSWMEQRGWSPQVDPNADLGFKAQMVREAARRMNGILYEIGKKAAGTLDEGSTSVMSELLKARQALQDSPAITPGMPASRAAAIQRQRDAAQKQVTELERQLGINQQPQPTANPPASPMQAQAQARNAAREALVGIQNLFGGTQASAQAAIDAVNAENGTPYTNTEDLLRAVLVRSAKIRAQQQPAPTPNATPAPATSPASAPSVAASPTPQPVAANATQTKTVPAVVAPSTEARSGDGTVQEGAEAPAAVTAEALARIAKDAGEKAVAELKATKPKTQQKALDAARDKAALAAMAQAHAAAHPDTDLVTWRENRFGGNSISGSKIDTADPFHQELLKRAGLSPTDISKLAEIQQNLGRPIGIEYLSAPESPGAKAAFDEALKNKQTASLRKKAQDEFSASGRAAGDTSIRRVTKSYIPQSITFNGPSGTFEVNGFSPDKFLANAEKLLPWLKRKGIETYSGVNDPQLIADLNGYAENHANGYLGNGSRPIEGTPLTQTPPNLDYAPRIIPKDRFDVLNALLGDQSARITNDTGEAKKGTIEQKASRAEKQVLAGKNSPFLNPETGEVNRIRELMTKEGDFSFTTEKGEEHTGAKVLESAWETLRPELIDKIGNPNIHNEQTMRPSSFTGDIGQIQGVPRAFYAASGFMPNDTLTDDMANQSDWMNSEAKRRGFSGLQELMENDPAAMTRMAAQWRIYHPRDEQGMLLQNDRTRAINTSLYGDKKSDDSRPAAGSRASLGDALSFVRGNAPASPEGPWDRAKESAALAQNDAIRKWAEYNGLIVKALDLGEDFGGNEHHVFPTDGRWIKSTRGTATGVGMGSYPWVKPDGSWELMMGTPEQYLESRKLQNQVFGDDIRLHGIQNKGKNVSVLTSQPDVAGEAANQRQIDSAMESAGFSRMDDATYYRRSDNIAVFDLHPANAVVTKDGALLPIDAIVVHPNEELLDALKDSRIQLLNRREAPKSAANFMDAARAAFMPREFTKDETGRMAPKAYRKSDATRIMVLADTLAEGGDAHIQEVSDEARQAGNWRNIEPKTEAQQKAVARMRLRETNALTELSGLIDRRRKAMKAIGMESELDQPTGGLVFDENGKQVWKEFPTGYDWVQWVREHNPAVKSSSK